MHTKKYLIETGVEKRYCVNYRRVSQLVDDYSPIKFSFSGAIDMIDLRNTELHVRAKIVDKEGGDVAEDQCVAPFNLILHSLFEKVDIVIQGKQMTHAMGGYPYAAYLKTIKCLGHWMRATWMPLVSCQRRTLTMKVKREPSIVVHFIEGSGSQRARHLKCKGDC